jgi:hypothetical protein
VAPLADHFQRERAADQVAFEVGVGERAGDGVARALRTVKKSGTPSKFAPIQTSVALPPAGQYRLFIGPC